MRAAVRRIALFLFGLGVGVAVDETVLFEVEVGDFEGAVDGIGGAFLKSG